MNEGFIECAGAVTIHVNCNESEPDSLEFTTETLKHLHVQRLRQLVRGDLNAYHVSVMPDAGLPETQRPHDFFPLIDHAKLFDSHRRAVRNPR